ncbi:MAG TPA: glycosyltransferase family 39 protein [Gaiellales bacterium]|nr:glycosyltransferase family 39 protein [Gaiellales bacterium]
MVSRARVRALAAEWWPGLLGGAAVVGYGILVVGFGLDFRPLHHDEAVTLHVAGQPSAGDVLHVAISDRHGPPLHYLIVHATLAWRHDILGLRLPSAVFGILAVALAYGCGRELLGRAGGAVVAVVTAVTPITIHLAQFARGYTAMIACAYGSLWLMLILVRTGRVRWAVPYALAALLLVSSHPFGLFALASELVLLAVLGGHALLTRRRGDRRALAAMGIGLVLAAGAFVWLRHLYAPLQTKYGVGKGQAVVSLTSRSFWSDLASHVTGSSVPAFWFVVGAAVVAGVVLLALRDRRAAIVAAVWLVLPLALLQILTASSEDFAPERHLSFMLPGYAIALAGLALELGRLPGRRRIAGAVVLALLLTPLVVSGRNDLSNFNADLRDASLGLAADFGPRDVLLTTAGIHGPLEDPRLLGAYAALAAPDSTPLAAWKTVDAASRCGLIRRLGQQQYPQRVWLLAATRNPLEVAQALDNIGATTSIYGNFVLAAAEPRYTRTRSVLYLGTRLWRQVAALEPGVRDFRRMARLYRFAAHLDSAQLCPQS